MDINVNQIIADALTDAMRDLQHAEAAAARLRGRVEGMQAIRDALIHAVQVAQAGAASDFDTTPGPFGGEL